MAVRLAVRPCQLATSHNNRLALTGHCILPMCGSGRSARYLHRPEIARAVCLENAPEIVRRKVFLNKQSTILVANTLLTEGKDISTYKFTRDNRCSHSSQPLV